jgi:hypothetical protein
MKLHAILLCTLFVGLSPAFAATKEALRIEPNEFAATRADIEAAIRKTDRYSELTRTQHEEMTAALDRMERVLSGVKSVDSLDQDTRTQLFNDQELINNLLTKVAEDSRLICRREKRVGSHRSTNTCITVGERRRQREAVQRDASYLQRGAVLQSD